MGTIFPQVPMKPGKRRLTRILRVIFNPLTVAAAAGSQLSGITDTLENDAFVVGVGAQYLGTAGPTVVNGALFRATWEFSGGNVKLATGETGARLMFGDDTSGQNPFPQPLRLPKGQQMVVNLLNDSGLIVRPQIGFWVIEYVTGDDDFKPPPGPRPANPVPRRR